MKRKIKAISSILMCLIIMFSLFAVDVYAGPTLTNNATGTFEGYDYEYWKDNGTGTMTLNGGGTFSCSWSNINNILFRTGKKLGSTKAWQDYGGISIDYACNYQPNGNSYMAVYGWTKDPLVEYYIIDSYGTWKPPGNNIPLKGTITVDGRTYEVYENTRTGPSIIGNTTFKQYWSICTQKRTSGVISVSKHFEEWEKKGMKMGKMYEVSMVVEGWQSQGKADMTKMNIIMGDTPSSSPSITNKPSTTPTPTKTTSSSPTQVTTNGDLNNDRVINMADVILMATSFNATRGSAKYNAAYDINNDGAINMADVLVIAQNFNKTVSQVTSNPPTTAVTTKAPTPTPTKTSSNPNAKLLALTFDDGPDNTKTAKVLDKLDKYKVPATFMMIGQNISSSTANIIKRVVNSGHEIGNHSWTYSSMNGLSSTQIKDYISKTNAAILQYAGVTPKFFRAPNLAYSQTLYDAVDLTFVQGVTCNDWVQSSSATDRANAIIAGAKDGTILLMHDNQPDPHPTPEALDILIPKLQSQGYEFVTLSELFERKGVALRANDNVAHTTLPN